MMTTALFLALIHPIAWKGYSPKFRGILRSSSPKDMKTGPMSKIGKGPQSLAGCERCSCAPSA